MIYKPDTNAKKLLAIQTVPDRAKQLLVKLALEP